MNCKFKIKCKYSDFFQCAVIHKANGWAYYYNQSNSPCPCSLYARGRGKMVDRVPLDSMDFWRIAGTMISEKDWIRILDGK